MTPWQTRLSGLTVLAMLGGASLLGACDQKPEGGPSAASASTPSPSASVPPEPPKPWYFGKWQGKLQIKKLEVEHEKNVGVIKAWTEDDGSAHTGDANVELSVDEHGKVTGSLTGTLGPATLEGVVEEENLRVQVMSDQRGLPEAIFNGTLVAKRESEAFVGTLNASSGDSLLLRQASVSLAKEGAASGLAKPKTAPGKPSAAPGASAAP